jgi:hypothetical protein
MTIGLNAHVLSLNPGSNNQVLMMVSQQWQTVQSSAFNVQG